MTDVIGAGIGQASARRLSTAKHLLMDGGVTASFRYGALAPDFDQTQKETR